VLLLFVSGDEEVTLVACVGVEIGTLETL